MFAMRRFSFCATRRRIRVSLCAAVAFLLLPLSQPALHATPPSRSQRPATSGLTGVIGHWTERTANGGEIVVDGEQWNGQTLIDALRAASTKMFGVVDTTLISTWSSPTAFPVALATGIPAFSSGTLRVRFDLRGGKSDQIAGIMFGLRANGEYYYVRYNTKDGNLALWQFANGARTMIQPGAVHKQLPLHAWHELEVTVRGREVRGVLLGDSTLSVTHTLNAPPSGRVGVWAKRDAVTAFQGFRAEPSASR